MIIALQICAKAERIVFGTHCTRLLFSEFSQFFLMVLLLYWQSCGSDPGRVMGIRIRDRNFPCLGDPLFVRKKHIKVPKHDLSSTPATPHGRKNQKNPDYKPIKFWELLILKSAHMPHEALHRFFDTVKTINDVHTTKSRTRVIFSLKV